MPEKVREYQECVLYLRFSPRPEREVPAGFPDLASVANSIEVQRARCRAYAASKNWRIAAEYAEPQASGRDNTRQVLGEALRHVERAKCVLLCWDTSRLSRSALFLLQVHERLKHKHCAIAFVADTIDTSTPAGRLMLGIRAVVDQYEAETISERTRNAAMFRASQGLPIGGTAPIGLVYDYAMVGGKRRVVKVTSDAKALELIADVVGWREKGKSLQWISDTLNEAGRHGPQGGRWNPSRIFKLLTRHGYKPRRELARMAKIARESLEQPPLVIGGA